MTNKAKTFIISRTDSIGDVVLTLPVAGILKGHFPDCKIIFLGRNYTKPVVECCEYVDEFISWDEIAPKEINHQIEIIRSLAADCIIHVFPNKKIALLAKKAKIPIRIGTSHRLFHWFTCNKLPNFTRKNSDLHEAQLNLKLLAALGITKKYSLGEIQSQFGFRKIKPLPQELRSMLDDNRIKLILHPTSKGSAREWGIENFSELIKFLPKDKFQVFVTGTKEDAEYLKNFISESNSVIDMTGKLSLSELISFINNCDVLVAASTGPLHLAAVLGKKAIGIYSSLRPIHAGRWAPIGMNSQYFVAEQICNNCKRGKPCNCMSSVKPHVVAERIIKGSE